MKIRKRVAIALAGSAIVLGVVGAAAVAVGVPTHIPVLAPASGDAPDLPEPGDSPDGPAD
ncbi:MAG: hypothetical protein QOD10_547 [Mycobacterium sp.]|jgi:hypothetical protein|nr:hypothetical protein [Mycobacterium sp.]